MIPPQANSLVQFSSYSQVHADTRWSQLSTQTYIIGLLKEKKIFPKRLKHGVAISQKHLTEPFDGMNQKAEKSSEQRRGRKKFPNAKANGVLSVSNDVQ